MMPLGKNLRKDLGDLQYLRVTKRKNILSRGWEVARETG
jgi:hypothetical protein